MNRKLIRLVISFSLMAIPLSFADASNYEWVDEWGTTHFTDDKSSIPTGVNAQEVRNSRLSIVSSNNGASSAARVGNGLLSNQGEFGHMTLEGIDDDKNGICDDIQRWIAVNYPDSMRMRAVLSQRAKAMQQFLIDSENQIKPIEMQWV